MRISTFPPIALYVEVILWNGYPFRFLRVTGSLMIVFVALYWNFGNEMKGKSQINYYLN